MISAPITPFVTPTLVLVQTALHAEAQNQAGGMTWVVMLLGIALAARLFVIVTRKGIAI